MNSDDCDNKQQQQQQERSARSDGCIPVGHVHPVRSSVMLVIIPQVRRPADFSVCVAGSRHSGLSLETC